MKSNLNVVNKKKKEELIQKFKQKYIDVSLLSKRILLWNALKVEVETELCRFEELSKFKIEETRYLYLYDDRNDVLYKLKYSEILDFIYNREPWEYFDGLIFDEELDWFIALTHEDLALIYGEIPVVARQ